LVYFIIPAYNEERNLPLLFKNTKAAMDELSTPYMIYIMNDGSTDRTSELCKEFSMTIPLREIKFEKNVGVGSAFKRGFEEIFKVVKTGDIIITKEADNTSDPDILRKMIELIHSGYDIVLASCFAREGGVENSTIDRHVLSFGANMLLKVSFPIRGVNTYSSFYRAYDAKRIKMAFEAYEGKILEEKGFVCMVEMLVKLSRLPLKITEEPMVLKCDKREGQSKMRRRNTIVGYLLFIKQQMFRSRKEDRLVRQRFSELANAHAAQ
jgi:dolichol-phosphate mannosyltransferase